MVHLEPFEVEEWMNEHETAATYNLAETCCASLSLSELQALSPSASTTPIFSLDEPLTYGPIRGSKALRSNLARLYSAITTNALSPDNVLITAGAISANTLIAYALTGPGDHVICHYPTYQQLYEVPASLGAEISLWKAREENNWMLDVEELKSLIRPNTRMIIINNPNNPTGAIMTSVQLEAIVAIAREHDIIVHADEVYRPLFHGINPLSSDFPPSILSLGYDKVTATGSLSKAYALAGIRVGWIASRSRALIETCARARDYTTISVSQIDDRVAAFATSANVVDKLLARNLTLARRNCQILADFVAKNADTCDWKRPVAGTTAFVRFRRDGKPVDDVDLCVTLQRETGVYFVPGSKCFGNCNDYKGYVRIGYACETRVLVEGLAKLAQFIDSSVYRTGIKMA